MKLIYGIFWRLTIALSFIFALWGIFFYMAIMNEVNEEIDDSLEDHAEQIIIRFLSGGEIPATDSHSNNQYYLREVSAEYAAGHPWVVYKDSMVYIPNKRETEPARILTTIYKDKEDKYYELVIFTPAIEKRDLKQAILFWMSFLYMGLLVVILVVNIWVYQYSNRPLYKLLAWLDRYRIGGKNASLDNNTDVVEFRKLNKVILRNARYIEKMFEEQKQFIGNASHEIQTPLAVCRNRIENLMEDETLSEHQLEELIKTQFTLEYITKLNKTLLLLSKIDNRQFTESGEVEFNSIIRTLVPDYEEVYSYMQIHMQIVDKGIFKARIHETLAHILINNLLKNTYVHNVLDGKILIEISPLKIVFKNTGQDYPLNPRLIFERFYQGTKKEGTAGLGLAIVKSITNMQNLNIRYYFENSLHCFEISILEN